VPALQDDLGVHNLNTDFDVYSKGADGAGTLAGGDPGNKDDIVRANDGTFVGMREEFE
jgi:general secretion pathway protein G